VVIEVEEWADVVVVVRPRERLIGEVIADTLRDVAGERLVVRLVVGAGGRLPAGTLVAVDGAEVTVVGSGDADGATVPASPGDRVETLGQLAARICGDAHSAVGCTLDDRLLPTSARLTNRELEVLEQVRQGVSNRAIASTLGISPHTVRSHVATIMRKLGGASRAEAIVGSTY